MAEQKKNYSGTPPSPPHKTRRKLVTLLGTGAAINLPKQWATPMVDSVILPAHGASTPGTGDDPGAGRQRPVADAGADKEVEDRDNDRFERVTLDGTNSSDADGTIDSYQWLENGQVIATSSAPTVSLAVGAHTLTLRVTDNDGLTGEDQVIITVLPQIDP